MKINKFCIFELLHQSNMCNLSLIFLAKNFSHKTHLISSPFPDVLWQRMITVLDVLFLPIWSPLYPLVSLAFIKWLRVFSGFYKMTTDFLGCIWHLFFCSILFWLWIHTIMWLTKCAKDSFIIDIAQWPNICIRQRLRLGLNNYLCWKFLRFVILIWSDRPYWCYCICLLNIWNNCA